MSDLVTNANTATLPITSSSIIKTTTRLAQTLAAVCPIVGVAVVSVATNPPTVRVDFDPAAGAEQIAAAEQALMAFDWSAQADTSWLAAQSAAAAQALLADTTSAIGKALQAIMTAANLNPAQVQQLVH